MRIRALLAGLIVGLVVLAPAGAAVAQEKDVPEATEECIERLERGGKPGDCQEAPSLLLPATNELVWGTLSFAILFGLLAKFAYPAIKKSMQDRTDRIRDSIDEADTAKNEAQRVLEDYQRQLADARNESTRIIEEARQAADQMRQDLIKRAEAEVTELRQRSTAEIAAAQQRAIADLQRQVRDLALSAAERVIERNLDRETNLALIDSFISQVGSTN